MEQWRKLAGFDGYSGAANIEVSDHGRVRQANTGLPIMQRIDQYKRLRVTFAKGGHTELVHRMVLITYMGPPPEGTVCCHWDGNPMNNKLSNLRWGTQKENALDLVRHKAEGTYMGPKRRRKRSANNAKRNG